MINPFTYITRLFSRRAQPDFNPRSLGGGRVSVNSANQMPSQNWLLLPPSGYESNWQLLTLDSKYLDRIDPTRLMEVLADLSPEVSRGLWDFQRLCNPGWTATAYRADGETQDKAAQARLNEFLGVLADRHGSTDTVINRLFMQPFLRGAFCAELVLDERGRMPVDLATPDPASIRFRQKTAPIYGPIWQPGQWQAHDFVPLDIPTFRYLPIDPMPASPYGRPMAAPALFTSLFLLGMFHDLKRVIQQQGYPRIDLSINTKDLLESAPHLASDAAAFQEFAAGLVAEVEQIYSQLKPDDAYIHTDVISVNRPVGAVDASSLAGIDATITALEHMAVRALKTMPLMMGITDGVGDIQSNRQWEVYAAGIRSIQKYAESLLDRLLTLALRVQGIQAEVWFRFKEVRSAEELRDTQVEAGKIQNAKAKFEAGWISQDEAAEEVTGHPADAPAPRTASATALQAPQGNNDSQEAVRTRSQVTEGRAQLTPEGADEPLPPLPEEVTISDRDIRRAIAEWDRLMPDYAGLLVAAVVDGAEDDEGRGSTGSPTAATRAEGDVWTYDPASKRYRNSATGRYLSRTQMLALRDDFIEAKKATATDLATRLNDGDISVQEFEIEFRDHIKIAFVDEYMLGRGGRNAMTETDWDTVGRLLDEQYDYAHRFATDIAAGLLTVAAIAARAALYFDSATQAYERGRVASYGMPPLPQYPGDGRTACLSNCKCSWFIEENSEEWKATWTLNRASEHCEDCQDNAARWSPLAISKASRGVTPVKVGANGYNSHD